MTPPETVPLVPDTLPDAVRHAAATAARGHNLVAALPPAPGHAAPLLDAFLAARAARGGVALLLAPEAEFAAWAPAGRAAAQRAGVRAVVADGPARATRRLREDALDLLIATPAAAQALIARSALVGERVAAIALVRPELLDADDAALTAVLSECSRDAARLVLTADPARANGLVERYARKALTVGVPAPTDAAPAPQGPVRTVRIGWSERPAAVARLLELLDPATAAIWHADAQEADLIRAALPTGDATVMLTQADAPAVALVVAYDLPTPARLAQLLQAGGEVVLLTPASTDDYVNMLAAPRRPIRLSAALEALAARAATIRAQVSAAVESRDLDRALLTLAPLLERHDAALVAAALLSLWQEAPAAATAPAPQAAATAEGTVRLWVGVGKADGLTPNDLVATITKELGFPKASVGRIELRDGFALVEVPAADAEAIARGLTGKTLRRKQVLARLDREPAAGERPARGGRPLGGKGGPRAPRSPSPGRGGRGPGGRRP